MAEENKKDKKENKEQSVETKGDNNETIVVSRKDLQAFLDRLESLEVENKKLFAVADKGRLYSEEERLAKQLGAPLVHTVKLTRLSPNGPIVIAWKLTDNDSYVEGNRMVEKQNMQVFYEDGKTETIRLIDFFRKQNKQLLAEIIKRSRNEETGEIELTVRLKDGKTLEIPVTYVN
jgi:hypothetical protein